MFSDACDYLTGETIAMDGGQRLAGPNTFAALTSMTDEDWRLARERNKTGSGGCQSAAQRMRTITSIDDAVAAAGAELGTSDWLLVDQARIDTFADATGDHQWIHVDPQRAAHRKSLWDNGRHGLLTLSL